MRRVPLFLLTLLPFAAIASAQTPAPSGPTFEAVMVASSGPVPISPEIVVSRLMTFDRDGDGRVAKDELPERMHNVLSADTSGDRALDGAEIRAMARSASAVAAPTAPGLVGGRGGGYTFGDQISLSTRSHVEGALDDLRLPQATQQRALAIIRPFMNRLEADASAVLMREVERVMPAGLFSTFMSAIERQMSENAPAAPAIALPDGNRAAKFVFRHGPDPAMIITTVQSAERAQAAQAAFDRFKARIRPGDADRAALLDDLKDVLSDEERENFGAALQRRPLVKTGGMFSRVVGDFSVRRLPPGIVGGVVGGVAGPAELRTPSPPEPRVVEP